MRLLGTKTKQIHKVNTIHTINVDAIRPELLLVHYTIQSISGNPFELANVKVRNTDPSASWIIRNLLKRKIRLIDFLLLYGIRFEKTISISMTEKIIYGRKRFWYIDLSMPHTNYEIVFDYINILRQASELEYHLLIYAEIIPRRLEKYRETLKRAIAKSKRPLLFDILDKTILPPKFVWKKLYCLLYQDKIPYNCDEYLEEYLIDEKTPPKIFRRLTIIDDYIYYDKIRFDGRYFDISNYLIDIVNENNQKYRLIILFNMYPLVSRLLI